MSRAHRVRLLVQTGVTVGILVALIIILNPGQLARDIAGFPLLMVPAAIGLTTCFYLTKGLRYHQLLRSEGIRLTPRQSILYTVGGEAFGLLPFGELARAEIASEATGAAIGTTAAAVTVQELLYTAVIVIVAIPGAVAYAAGGISGITTSLAAIVAILGILTIRPIFHAVLAVVRRVPLLRRAAPQLEVLHEQTVHLLRRPGTWSWVILSVLGALFELTLFWLMVWGASGMPIPWVTTTFIYGAAYLAGAATSPGGGIGGFEGTAIALLQNQGVAGPAAVAAALLQRAADKGLITLAGFGAWFWVRRHLRLRRGLLLGEGDQAVAQPPERAPVAGVLAPAPGALSVALAAAPARVAGSRTDAGPAASPGASGMAQPAALPVPLTLAWPAPLDARRVPRRARARPGSAAAGTGTSAAARRGSPGTWRRRLAINLVSGAATLVAGIATVAQRPWG